MWELSVRHADSFPNSDFDYPKGQLSGMVATPEYKAASLTTRTVSSKPKRTFASHGSGAGFPDRLFIPDQPAPGLLVRTAAQF